jgi:hypothetical protein
VRRVERIYRGHCAQCSEAADTVGTPQHA